MIDDEFATYDAAYLMGALSDDEQRRYEDHLRVCDRCAASVRSLHHLPLLLATVPPEILEDEPDNPPVSLLPALLARARRERRRRRLLIAAVTAVAAACVVLAVVLAWPSGRTATPPAPSRGTAVAMSAPGGEAVGVEASVRIQTVGWGTRIDLSCRHVPSGGSYGATAPYQLVIVDRGGGTEALGTWNLPTGRDITFTGGTSLPATKIREVKVTTLDGEDLLVGWPCARIAGAKRRPVSSDNRTDAGRSPTLG